MNRVCPKAGKLSEQRGRENGLKMGDFAGHLAGKAGSKGLILGLKPCKKIGFSRAESVFS